MNSNNALLPLRTAVAYIPVLGLPPPLGYAHAPWLLNLVQALAGVKAAMSRVPDDGRLQYD